MNKNMLNQICDTERVAEEIGMNIQRKGKHKYILCPGHYARLGKPDFHIGNCTLLDNGYYCFSCKAKVSAANMIMEFTGCTESEAYTTIASVMGVNLSELDAKEENKEIPKLRLTREEAETIKFYQVYTNLINQSNSHGQLCKEGIYPLYMQNKERYYNMILCRAREMLEKYEGCRQFASVEAKRAYIVYDLLADQFDMSIYGRLERELEKKIGICKRIIQIFSSRI